MRFVAVKSEEQQAAGLLFRTRDLLVRQRTQLINTLTEYGWIAPKGPSHVTILADLIEEEEMANSLPEAALAMFRLMLDLLAGLSGKIADLDKEIARRAREDDVSRRLMTIPGIGPICATAIAASSTAGRDLCQGPRLCRLAGSHASSKDRPAANRSSVRHPKWANARSGAFSSSAAAPSCFRRANAARFANKMARIV